jgi:hypothetical protein
MPVRLKAGLVSMRYSMACAPLSVIEKAIGGGSGGELPVGLGRRAAEELAECLGKGIR